MNRGSFARTRWVVALGITFGVSLALAQQRPQAGGGRTGGAAGGSGTTAAAPAAPTTPTPGVAAVGPNVCIPQDHATAAGQCPPNAVRFGGVSRTAPPAAARAVQEERTKAARQKGAPTVQLDEATARRRGNLQRRSEELLLREVQLTATLARNTPRNDPHRPDVLMRLAESLQELSSLENGRGRDLDETIFQANAQHNERRVAELRREQATHLTNARNYRGQLIRTFETLVVEHNNYSRLDEALFYLAFAYQDARDQQNARRVYLELIRRFPQSRFIPNAYLSFAEFFFEQGAMEEARQFYERVVAIDTPENQVRAYAMYKLAWVHFNLSNFDQSLQRFYDVIEYARQHTEVPSHASLMRSARNELVSAYGQVYGVTRPLRTGETLNTFRRYGADENNAFEMLERLGELYNDNGQWTNSIAVYHQLMESRSTSDRFCRWQAQVTRAFVAQNRRDEEMVEMNRLLDVYAAYGQPNSGRSPAVRGECRDNAARIIFDVASHWHLEAIGRSAEGQVQTRGTRSPQTMTRVAQLYNILLERFPDLDQVTYPDYQRPDWPSRYRIAYYAADILRDQGNFAECGPAYDRVVEMNPSGEFTEDASYKAVLCYNDDFTRRLGTQSHERTRNVGQAPAAADTAAGGARRRGPAAVDASRFAPRPLNPGETGMLRAFTRYVCFSQGHIEGGGPAGNRPAPAVAPTPPAGSGEAPDADLRTTLLTIRYRRAYMHYVANHFEESSTLFREIAFSDPAAPDPENLREIAADLYLDALNVMGSQWNPARPQCIMELTNEVPRMKERFCSATARSSHEDFCSRMDRLQCDSLRLRAQSLHSARRFLEAGRAYVDIIRVHPECLRNADVRSDEILYNAAIEFDAANLLGRAMRVREVLVDRFLPAPVGRCGQTGPNSRCNSEWAQRALFRLAGNYHRIQVFSRASDFYERYADYVHDHSAEATRADPEAVNQAADALRQATIFRIGLGEDAHALENSQKFARYFGTDPNRRRAAATVVFSIGQIFIDRAGRLARVTGGTDADRASRQRQIRAAWGEVVRHYTGFVNRYARQGTLDQQIQGNVALGRAYWNLEDETHAQLYFRAAVAAWGEAPAAPAGTPSTAPRAAAPGEGRIREQLGAESADAIERTRDGVAEARFYLAETLYRRFTARRLPTYHGAATRAAYDAWQTRTLSPFIVEQRRYLQEDASTQYQQVIGMHVPNWEIAGAARLADMFFQFANYIRNAEVPPDIRRNPDLLDAYNVMRDENTQIFITLAKTGFEACITRSTQVHWFNEWSQLCERSLNQIDRRQYPLADEIRMEPNLLFSRPALARPFYQVGEGEDDSEGSGGASGGALSGNADTSDAPGTPGAGTSGGGAH